VSSALVAVRPRGTTVEDRRARPAPFARTLRPWSAAGDDIRLASYPAGRAATCPRPLTVLCRPDSSRSRRPASRLLVADPGRSHLSPPAVGRGVPRRRRVEDLEPVPPTTAPPPYPRDVRSTIGTAPTGAAVRTSPRRPQPLPVSCEAPDGVVGPHDDYTGRTHEPTEHRPRPGRRTPYGRRSGAGHLPAGPGFRACQRPRSCSRRGVSGRDARVHAVQP